MPAYVLRLSLAILCAVPAVAPGQAAPSVFTDARDGYTYRVVTIGGLRWFAENLRFKTGDSRCYERDEANCADHGRLYRLEDALRACPAGWRVPTEDDWRMLEHALGLPDSELAKERARGDPVARRLKVGGDTRFDVRYSGWIDPHKADSSIGMGRNAAYWSSTAGAPDESSATAWHRDIATTRNSIYRSLVNVTYWLAVRCVGG